MTVPLADVVRQLRMLVGRPGTADMSDAQLLERFVSTQEDAAFEKLMARHGAMVLNVCGQLLANPHDAEDAFQATFLILVRRASSIRRRGQVAGWLYGVAQRVASRLRAQGARQAARAKQGVEYVAAEPSSGIEMNDQQRMIHEEVNRLPERYRTPIVLCYLEGKTLQEVARDLDWTHGMVKGRLERARNLLRMRLAKRGAAPSAGVLTAIALQEARAVPPALASATVRAAALLTAGKELAAGGFSSQVVSLVEGVLKTMFFTKLKIATAFLLVLGAVGAGAALVVHRSQAGDRPSPQQNVDPERPPSGSNQPSGVAIAAPVGPSPLKVEVTKAISRTIVDHSQFGGRTEAATRQVVARLSGELIAINVPPEGIVKQGDVLFQIDSRSFQVELSKARADLAAAQARLRAADAELKRVQKDVAERSASTYDLLRVNARQEEAAAGLKAAQANLELVQLQLDSTSIRAPISGHVGQSLVTAGAYVKVGTPLATILARNPLYVNFDIDERTFLLLERQSPKNKVNLLGASVQIGLTDEKDFPRSATVDFVAKEINPITGTLRVRAVLPNPDSLLLPGMFVQVRLATSKAHGAILVPEQAVLRREGQPTLWLLTEQNTVKTMPVQLGQLQDGWRVIRNGVTAGDKIIVTNQSKLKPGVSVQPELAEVKQLPGDRNESDQNKPPARKDINQ
jgi:RND family efflux transporter MFP subunit